MNVPVMLLNSVRGNPFRQISKPVVELLNMTLIPIPEVIGALGAIYRVFLGAKLAKAEEPQGKKKAKNSLKNATMGFMLIFALIVVLEIGMDAVSNWMDSVMSNAAP